MRCGNNQNISFFQQVAQLGGGTHVVLEGPSGLAQAMNIIIEKESERAKWEVRIKLNDGLIKHKMENIVVLMHVGLRRRCVSSSGCGRQVLRELF